MYAWETALTTRDTNRIVRPLEWGFDWLNDFSPIAAECAKGSLQTPVPDATSLKQMIAVNEDIVSRSKDFFGYETPKDFRLELRHPQGAQLGLHGDLLLHQLLGHHHFVLVQEV